MPGKTSTLTVRIVSDAKSAAAGFAQADQAAGKFTDGLDRMSVKAGIALVAVAGVAKQAYDAASKLQQSTGATEAVFGAQADAIKAQAAQAAQAVGLSKNSYQEMASVIGSQLKNMGIAQDQLVPKTQGLIKLGADLSAVYGGTAADAVQALSALLRGETDPIERYGVSIKQSTINTQLAADGHAKLKGTALQAAQAQAVLELLTTQTSSAVGQFAAQSDTAAEKTQIASAQFENAKAALGNALLPIVVRVADALGGLANWMEHNSDKATVLAGVIGGLAGAILIANFALAAYRTVATIATGVQWALNAAMDANPIGLIIIGIAGLITVVVLIVTHIKTFIGWLKKAWEWIQKVADLLTGGALSAATGGPSFFSAARPGPAAPAAPAAPAGAYGAVAGARLGAAAAGGGGGRLALPGGLGRPGDTINITIQGATDKEGTADQLRRMLDNRDRQTGRASSLTFGLSR